MNGDNIFNPSFGIGERDAIDGDIVGGGGGVVGVSYAGLVEREQRKQ